jgi:hypothetical protein
VVSRVGLEPTRSSQQVNELGPRVRVLCPSLRHLAATSFWNWGYSSAKSTRLALAFPSGPAGLSPGSRMKTRAASTFPGPDLRIQRTGGQRPRDRGRRIREVVRKVHFREIDLHGRLAGLAEGFRRSVQPERRAIHSGLEDGLGVISTFEGMFERNGMPIFRSLTVCIVFSGRSSKSTLPPSTRMLFTEKRSGASSFFGFSAGFGFDASSRRSWTLYVPSTSVRDGFVTVSARITGPPRKIEAASRFT